MTIARWLRASAAVAAVAALNVAGAPPAQAQVLPAPTPCNNPSGTVAEGYVAGHYVLLQHARVADLNGVKVCFQLGSNPLSPTDTYGVVDVRFPSASAAPTRGDNNSDACMYYGGSELAYNSNDQGTFRVSQRRTTSELWVCLEGYQGDGSRVLSNRLIVPLPAVGVSPPAAGYVVPAPPRDTSLVSNWPAGAPSSECAGPGSGTITNLFVAGQALRIQSSEQGIDGTTSLCVRRQGVNGTGSGGKLTTNTGALPSVTTSGDLTPCTQKVNHASLAGGLVYLHIDRSVDDNPQSVCVSTAPGTGTRVTLSSDPFDVVTFTPDP